jgi:formate dehydrogenase iron-sulfur subunit
MSKNIDRRSIVKLLAAVPFLTTIGCGGKALAAPGRYAKLVDTTLCIGCKRCMSACKRWNDLEIERDEMTTDRDLDLSANNWVVVNLRTDAKNKRDKTYGHWACQHCAKPACAGVCPVTAISKLDSGPVVINENKCIGCRYCLQACPYKIPRFDFKRRITRKCHMCYNRTGPLSSMKPACVGACPVKALRYGLRKDMVIYAKKRAVDLGNQTYIMGLKDAGGTDMITILPTNPKDLGFVVADQKVINQNLDKIRISAAGVAAASVLAGGLYAYSEITKSDDEEEH